MFPLIGNAQKLLEVKAKAPMCHPLLTHRRKSDIKDFQSLRCSICKKCNCTSRVQQLIKKVTQGICHRPGEREMELNSNHIPCSANTTLILVHILTVPWLASMAVFRGDPNNTIFLFHEWVFFSVTLCKGNQNLTLQAPIRTKLKKTRKG